MGNLILNSLEVQGFRAFRNLKIDRLGRVNLIVGSNNVGKTSLLEALSLFANRGNPALIWQILVSRDESGGVSFKNVGSTEEWVSSIRYLFNGRKKNQEFPASIQIGPAKSPENKMSLNFYWKKQKFNFNGQTGPEDEDNEVQSNFLSNTFNLKVALGDKTLSNYKLNGQDFYRNSERLELAKIPCVFLSVNGLTRNQISRFWDETALTRAEEDLLSTLRIVAPQVERVAFVGSKDPSGDRIPLVKLQGQEAPFPLKSLGEGMNRVFSLGLAMVNSRNGFLLVDEIESNLHYSVQSDLWGFIFEVARRFNIQVFATTHSSDCVEAFQKAARLDKQEESMLIRLEYRRGDVTSKIFDKDELAIVNREQLEIR